MSETFTIAVDGPAAAGKGTISKAVAAHYGFGHLDTGLLYRAVGAKTMEGVPAVEAAQSLTPQDLAREDLRGPEVAQAASKVAVIAEVRAALVDFQRAFARRAGGAVLDGRDIGTVICPYAQVKLFVTASAEARAGRRLAELLEAGHDASFDSVLADVKARDARDSERAAAPLRPAEDAFLLDTSDLDAAQAVSAAVARVSTMAALPLLLLLAASTAAGLAATSGAHVVLSGGRRKARCGSAHAQAKLPSVSTHTSAQSLVVSAAHSSTFTHGVGSSPSPAEFLGREGRGVNRG